MKNLFLSETDDNCRKFSFYCMGGSCEVLSEEVEEIVFRNLSSVIEREARRIEQKYSRYNAEGVVFQINSRASRRIKLDPETIELVNFAFRCHELSGGLFDITSGILRKAWTFDQTDNIPDRELVESLLPFIGLDKVFWNKPFLKIPEGMEIDFGGIGKEYAVDRCIFEAQKMTEAPVLVNFGGDLSVTKSRSGGKPWIVGMAGSDRVLTLYQGAIATSGDSNKYLVKNGRRLSHILNPKTGYPIQQSVSSVSVRGETCTEAGLLATMALLNGEGAKDFLEKESKEYWISPSI